MRTLTRLSVVGSALLLLFMMVSMLAPADPASAATSATFTDRTTFEAELGPGTMSLDGYEVTDGYPAAFTILDAVDMNAAFGETDYASTYFSPPNWNFITGSASNQYYCAGCNGSFRLTFDTATETCPGAVYDGVYGVGFNVRSHSFSTNPAGPYSAFVTYGDGTTENFDFPSGASFFGITSPDLIANIHVAVNDQITSSGSFSVDNMTLGNSPGGCGGGGPSVRLLGTTGYGYESTSDLVELDPATGGILQVIGPVGHTVNGLDYDATTGTLYGSTSVSDPIHNGLITIDMNTGAGTPVGANWWGTGSGYEPVTNITVDSAGDMYGWTEYSPAGYDDLVRIDKNAGTYTWVGESGVGTAQNGLSFDSVDDLYMINVGGPIFSVDTGTGAAVQVGNFGTTAHHGDFHPLTDQYYGITWEYGVPRNVLICDMQQQFCDQYDEVGDLHTLAFVFEQEQEPGADLSIEKSVSPDPLVAGMPGTYTVVATNNGPDAAWGVSITEYGVIGVELTGVSCPGTAPELLADRVVCTWDDVTEVGQTRTMVLDGYVCAEITCDMTIDNTAEVTHNEEQSEAEDPNPDNNIVQLQTEVTAQSDLYISKTDSPDPVYAGQPLTYDLTVRNYGPSNADRAIITDELPMWTTFVSATSTPPGVACSASGKTLTCDLGTLGAPNQCETSFPEEYQISIEVLVSDLAPSTVGNCTDDPLYNEATVASANCLPDTGTLMASALTDVIAGADVEVGTPIVEPQGECVGPGAYIHVTQSFGNTGPENYSVQRDNPGAEFIALLPAGVIGVPGSCVVVEGSGTCQINMGQVMWNGSIDIDETVTLQYRLRVRGGVEFGTEFCIGAQVNYDECNTGVNTASRSPEEDVCITADCESLLDPNVQLGMQVHLPILSFIGQDDCDVWIEVQNIGAADVKGVLVTWGEAGFCPPQAAGPLKVECTGLLRPGTTWNLMGDQIPDGSKSGMLFKFSTKQLSDFGLDEIFGFDDIFADLMCETMFFGVVGDSDDWRRFKKAYNEGGTFAGIPMDIAAGADDGGILAVDVLRTCDADTTPGAKVTSKYNGISGSHLGTYDQVYGGYSYYVPLVYAQRDKFNTWVYIQNGGLECSSVEIWLKAQDDCLRSQICEVSALAPGETYQFDPNTCVGPGWVGSLWLRTSQPMGVAVDIYGDDILMTYVGEPAELNYTFDPEQADVSPGNQVAFGPLVYSEYQGWDSAVQVQNLSPVVNAKVKVYFMDRGGGVITTLVDWICPRGAQTYFLPVVSDLPGNWVGSIRVESQEYLVPGGPAVRAPNVVAVAALIKYSDAVRTSTREAMAYNLLPEHKIFDWQVGGMGAGGLEGGVGLIAVPSLLKDLDGTGVASELAITNVVPKPGFTDFVIYIYDQNGLLDYVCEKLNEKQVEYIELSSWGYINDGFKGSAIISAFFWEHDVFGDDGFFLRNLVGLGAVTVERSLTKLGLDIPGDEAAGSRGIPFRESDIEDAEFHFNFLGEFPQCPGLPDQRPEPGECPDSLTVTCTNCPVSLPDLTGGTGEIAGVNVPSGCKVTDVDMLVDITHTYDGDLIVDLSSNALQNVPMWNGICGGNDNIQAILDDEAGAMIGSVCPPSGFQRYTTDPPGGMTMFEGMDPNGTWLLDIQDQFGGDQGTLNNWELTFTIQ